MLTDGADLHIKNLLGSKLSSSVKSVRSKTELNYE